MAHGRRRIARIDGTQRSAGRLVARGGARLAALVDCRKAVVCRGEHVGGLVDVKRLQRGKQTRERFVGILDARLAGRAIDARRQ